MNTNIIQSVAVSGLLFAMAGCASVSIEKETWKSGPVRTPERILVETHAAPLDALRVDRDAEQLEAFRADLSEKFAGRLVERLSKNIAPTVKAAEAGKTKPGDWIIDGEFTRVNQGSRLLRSLFGWGLGGTKMEARTRIALVGKGGKREPLAEIWTTGGSNAEPGAVFGGPFAAAPRLVLNASLTGVSADARRTARVVVAAISEKLVSEGQPVAGEPLAAKRLGEVPESPAAKRAPGAAIPR